MGKGNMRGNRYRVSRKGKESAPVVYCFLWKKEEVRRDILHPMILITIALGYFFSSITCSGLVLSSRSSVGKI